jgi:hypothetical protein
LRSSLEARARARAPQDDGHCLLPLVLKGFSHRRLWCFAVLTFQTSTLSCWLFFSNWMHAIGAGDRVGRLAFVRKF